MIFYFTGTGNSLAAAKALLAPGEALINMADALKNHEFRFRAEEHEKVGFVFPVYFYTLPTIVKHFIEGLNLENAHYIYAVITCGGGIAQAGAVLKKALEKRNLKLGYVTELLMPDNYILLYKNRMDGVDECLANAQKRLEEIAKKEVGVEIKKDIGSNTIISDLVEKLYRIACKTEKFYAEDSCVGCGMCEKNCPEQAITLTKGKPKWTKKKCCQCLACIHHCPKNAIQYGKRTKNQGRYVHPDGKELK